MTRPVGLWPAHRLAAAVRTGALSSLELLEHYLDRIERLDPVLRAVVTVDAERARSEAARADEAVARRAPLGPLLGVPVTVKDAIEVAGMRSTGGAVELADHVPAADAPAVARLRASGAIVVGKTNCPRWSADVETYNDLFGTTANPWDRDRTPGGSSGGPAAAVSAGLSGLELGTDIGGSIRTPSHFCGVFGLRPTYGVVPQRGYLDHVGGGTTDVDLNVFGPIARSAEDLDLALGLLAGPTPGDGRAWRLELPAPRRREPAGLRVAVWADDPVAPVERGYRSLLERTADRLSDAGAQVREGRPPGDPAQHYELFLALIGAATARSRTTPEHWSHLDWLRACEARAAVRSRWDEWFESHDVLLCPVACTAAFPHDQGGEVWEKTLLVDGVERSHLELFTCWTGLVGLVGLPAAVAPIGFTGAGLPVGVQVVAGRYRDREAVHVAGLVADLLGSYRPPPLALEL
jgi:amidase